MDKDLAGQVVDIAQRVVASGAISANGHFTAVVSSPCRPGTLVRCGSPCGSGPAPRVQASAGSAMAR